ncbi:hypothetical protein ERJ75_000131500 [Trypanosoma vivax]|uniref:Uncharacterized protein n=1 Tax=Trypanosoma vivax (strain Y486) TaxID=1055687 RepID=G0TT55_TRYVY|nr:hypothetical protein TRVL_06942 [Trypanosoma vivax]KAH8619782.1 hypothetical protein ERJ75_000131500 [Trypanosoma vivax]CCC47136.1 conserved hypothetical protein [Trypanosoma vivax Y486]
MPIFGRVSLYLDLRDPELICHAKECASALCENAERLQVHVRSGDDALEFVRLWESEKARLIERIQETTPYIRRFECFVTDRWDTSSGAVAYALFCRKMPVLSLVHSTEESLEKQKDCGDEWVTAALYQTITKLGCGSAAEALNAFFTFPSKMGRALAVEGECSAAVKRCCELLCQRLRDDHGMRLYLVGPNGCDVEACGEEMEEAEVGLFASLIADLASKEELQPIQEAHTHLPGALRGLNRHENLPILRYRLQRGSSVIFFRPMSQTIEEIYCRTVREEGADAAEAFKSFLAMLKVLMNFEHRWLDLPEADVILVHGVCKCGGKQSCGWSSWLSEGPHKADVAAVINWRLIPAKDISKDTNGALSHPSFDELVSVIRTTAID